MIKQAKVYKTPGIYKIQNRTTRDFYIGSSMNCYKRMYQHQTLLRNNRHHSPHLQHAWNKYGQDGFEYLVLEYVNVETLSELHKIEQRYLDELHPVYNVSKDAISPLSTKFTPRKKSHVEKVLPQNKSNWNDVKQKISNTVKNLWSNPEYRENQISCMRTQESKLNRSVATKSKWKDEKYRIKATTSMKNKLLSDDNSRKLSRESVIKIRELHSQGNSITQIANSLELNYKNVWRVVTGATWDFV